MILSLLRGNKMETNIRAIVKSLLSLNCMTLTQLCDEMTKRTGKAYTLDSLGGKLKRESFSLKEAYIMADILGYDIEFVRRK